MKHHSWTAEDGAQCIVYENGTATVGRESHRIPWDIAQELVRAGNTPAEKFGRSGDVAQLLGALTESS